MNRHEEMVQGHYASMLTWLVRIGFVFMFVSFAVYAVGLLPAEVPLNEVPDLWTRSAEEFAEAAGTEQGWGWIRSLDDGQVVSFAALVLFPAGTMILIGIASLLYLRERNRLYAFIAALEFVVLVVAATGLLAGAN